MAKRHQFKFKQKCVYCGKTLYWFSNKNFPLDVEQDGYICDDCNNEILPQRTQRIAYEVAKSFHDMKMELEESFRSGK